MPSSLLGVWLEGEADRVDAVALVRRRLEPLALEHVAQVAAACRARDLHAVPVGVGCARHGTGDGVEEGRPATSAVELLLPATNKSDIHWNILAIMKTIQHSIGYSL